MLIYSPLYAATQFLHTNIIQFLLSRLIGSNPHAVMEC